MKRVLASKQGPFGTQRGGIKKAIVTGVDAPNNPVAPPIETGCGDQVDGFESHLAWW